MKLLRPSVDLASGKCVVLGRLDDDNADVQADGISLGLSEQLGCALGNLVDTFHTLWRFRNCEAGRTYVIRYHLYRASEAGLEYWAKGDNAGILSGEAFTAPTSLARGKGGVWEIRFSPKQSGECSVKVGYDFRDAGKLLFVDRIDIVPANLDGG